MSGEIVSNNGKNNGKLLGGITGKGFMPGQSGNPRGRPRNLVSDAYRKYLKRQAPESVREKLEAKGYQIKTGADAMAVGQLESAIRGFAPCAKELREATEGKAPDHLELTGANAGPMQIEVAIIHIGAPIKRNG